MEENECKKREIGRYKTLSGRQTLCKTRKNFNNNKEKQEKLFGEEDLKRFSKTQLKSEILKATSMLDAISLLGKDGKDVEIEGR